MFRNRGGNIHTYKLIHGARNQSWTGATLPEERNPKKLNWTLWHRAEAKEPQREPEGRRLIKATAGTCARSDKVIILPGEIEVDSERAQDCTRTVPVWYVNPKYWDIFRPRPRKLFNTDWSGWQGLPRELCWRRKSDWLRKMSKCSPQRLLIGEQKGASGKSYGV